MPLTLEYDPDEPLDSLVDDLLHQYAAARDDHQRATHDDDPQSLRALMLGLGASATMVDAGLARGSDGDDVEVTPYDFLKFFEQSATHALALVRGLVVATPEDRLGFMATAMQQGEQWYHVHEHLDTLLARALIPRLWRSRARCLDILDLVLRTAPGPRVGRYLRHLSHHYLAQQDAVVIMLCRAVLESAVSDRFRLAAVDPMPGRMRERLAAARARHWLDAATERDAWIVWQRGNKAMHEDPDLVVDAKGTLTMTLAICARLYRDVPDDPAAEPGAVSPSPTDDVQS